VANAKLNPVALARLRGQEAPNDEQPDREDAVIIPARPRPIAAIIADLSRPLPARHVRSRVQGGKTLHYLEWHVAVRYLDHFAPGWTCAVRGVTALAGRCVVTVRVTIPAAEGPVHREATGTEDEDLSGYGDPSSNAEAMALKRAAAKFGLGLYLYSAK